MRLLLLFFFISLSSTSLAQDPHFSQYFANPLYLNPAFAGYNGCPTIHAAYRNQWPEISGNFQNVNGSFDYLIGQMHGIGVNYIYNNSAGTLESHSVDVIYSPVFRLFKKQLTISPAFGLGLKHRSVNFDKLQFGDMIDPRYGYVYEFSEQRSADQRLIGDLSTGLLLTWKGLVAGFAAHHITQPDEGFAGLSVLPVNLATHINYQFNIANRIKISPAFIFHNQQDFNSMLPSVTIEAYGVRVGFAFRSSFTNPDAAIFMVGYRGHGVSVGYSYDLTVSSLTNNTGGSHEVSLAYVLKCKKSEYEKGVRLINF